MSSTNGIRSSHVILPDDVAIDKTYNNNNGIKLSHTESGSTVSTAFNNITDFGATVNKVSETTYQIDFDQAFSALQTYTTAQFAKANTGVKVVYTEQDDQNTKTITITCSAGNDIVNLTASEVASNKIVVVAADGTTDYSLVINVTDAGTDAIAFNKSITIDGESAGGYGANTGKVLWNFGSQACNVTFQETNGGVILAPSGSVLVKASHNGSVYAKTVENNGCEIHQNGFRTVTPTSASLTVSKTVSGTGAPADDAFTFTATVGGTAYANQAYTLYDATGTEVTGTHTTDADGKFTLTAGQKAVFSGLAVGKDWSVTETAKADYTQTSPSTGSVSGTVSAASVPYGSQTASP